jgi:hypothetical protein
MQRARNLARLFHFGRSTRFNDESFLPSTNLRPSSIGMRGTAVFAASVFP